MGDYGEPGNPRDRIRQEMMAEGMGSEQPIVHTLDPLVRCPRCKVLGRTDSLPNGRSTCRVCRHVWTPNDQVDRTL